METTDLDKIAGDVIDAERAEAQIDLLFDYYEIDLDDYGDLKVNGTSTKKALTVAKKKLLRAVRKGRLEIIDEDGQFYVKQYLNGKYAVGPSITYKPLSGRAKVAMDKHDEDNARMYALLGCMAGVKESEIYSLIGVDITTAECLGGFFSLA